MGTWKRSACRDPGKTNAEDRLESTFLEFMFLTKSNRMEHDQCRATLICSASNSVNSACLGIVKDVPFPRTAKEVGPSLVEKVTEVNLLHGPWYEFLSYMRTKAAMSRWPWYEILNCKRIEDAAVRCKLRTFIVHRKW